MTLNLDDIEQKAKAATPGEWRVIGFTSVQPGYYSVIVGKSDLARYVSREDAAHIASASPANTLAMVAEIRRLEQKLEVTSGFAVEQNERATWLAKDGLARAQENKRLREALEPFAELARGLPEWVLDGNSASVLVRHLFAARAALEEGP